MAFALSRVAGAAALAGALAFAGCSSTPSTPFVDPDVPAVSVNPDGLAYPTDHIGTRARSKVRAGDRLANFAFQGYLDGNPQGTLKTLAMADLYDPDANRSRLLHIHGAAGSSPWAAR